MSITGDKSLDESVWWLLQKLNAFLASSEKEDVFYLNEQIFKDDKSAPSYAMQTMAVDYLEMHGAITTNTGLLPTPRAALHPRPEDRHDDNAYKMTTMIAIKHPTFEERYKQFEGQFKPVTPSAVPVEVKQVRLDTKNYQLEINKGQKVISFKSKRQKNGLEAETKIFKVLVYLWEQAKWELGKKDGRVLEKGDWVSLENLKRGSESESTEAARKLIERLNTKFANEGVEDVKAEIRNDQCRLVINRS